MTTRRRQSNGNQRRQRVTETIQPISISLDPEKERRKIRRYPETYIAQALIRLEMNGGNVARTAAELQISPKRLQQWRSDYNDNFEFQMDKVLERSIKLVRGMMPAEFTPQEWSQSLEILLDKWLTLNGQNITRIEVMMSELGNKSNSELDDLINSINERLGDEDSDQAYQDELRSMIDYGDQDTE